MNLCKMGNIRHSICLLLALWLLLSGCGQNYNVEKSQTTPSITLSTPSPAPLVVSTEDVEVAQVSTAENHPESFRVVLKPPPIRKRKPPLIRRSLPPASAPSPRPVSRKQPPPSMSLEESYPKANPSSSFVKKAEDASGALDRVIQSGQLVAGFWGTGDLREMVHFNLHNSSHRPVRVRLVSGMILKPKEYEKVQPLLVTEDADFVLQPGESHAGNLQSYCMDSRVPAPLDGQPVNYRFSSRTKDGGERAVRAQKAAEKLAISHPHRHAIIQLSIWKSLEQPVEDKHLYSVLGALANDPEVRRDVLREVERVLKSL